MKTQYFLLILLTALALTIHGPASSHRDQDTDANTETESEFWWEMELTMSVTGSYRYNFNNIDHDGEYSFNIRAAGGLEQDISKDYILYGGDPEITDLHWTDSTSTKEMKPGLRLNYVLNEGRYIYFDLEVFLQPSPTEEPGPFAHFLLPRSALNKDINKKDKYNKNVVQGSNNVRIPEESILQKDETFTEFKWQWERNKNGLMNAHSVEMKIKITRKKKGGSFRENRPPEPPEKAFI